MLLPIPPSLPPAFLGRCWAWINPSSWRCLSVRPQGEENKWQVHDSGSCLAEGVFQSQVAHLAAGYDKNEI